MEKFHWSRVDRCNIVIYYLILFPFTHNANLSDFFNQVLQKLSYKLSDKSGISSHWFNEILL